MNKNISNIIQSFDIEDRFLEIQQLGGGLINDIKITNILFDKNTNEVAAIVDWDTIMPNMILSDFGDIVRTFCNSADEDEMNLELVNFRLYYFLLDTFRVIF